MKRKLIIVGSLAAVGCMCWIIGCSKRETSSSELLHRIATDATELKRRGYEAVTITESGWVGWVKDGRQGMSSPTIAELKPGESIQTPPIVSASGVNKQKP